MAVIDTNTKRTLKVLDIVKGRTSISKPADYAEALFQLTGMIRLFNIEERLKSGWGKYIYDKTINELGDDAEEKLRAKRKAVLQALATLGQDELNNIPASLRREIIEQRILDYEPNIRETYQKLLLDLLGTKDLRFIKLSTHSPKPVSILYSEGNATLLTFDNFYIDPATVRLFDSRKDAIEFIVRLSVALIYCRRKNLMTGDDIAGDTRAADYTRKVYKSFLKSVGEENNDNLAIGDFLKEFELHEAAQRLMAKDSFYMTMKNMAPAVLIEFEPSRLHVTSFLGEGTFTFDEFGRDKITSLISRDSNGGRLYLSGVASLFDYLVKNFSSYDAYLERDFTIASISRNPWTKKLPMKIIAESTADSAKADVGTRALVGLKKLAIVFSDNEFIELVKPETDFGFDPIHHSFIYSSTTMIYPESGMMHGNFYAMPEVDVLFNELINSGKVNKQAVAKANLMFSRIGRGKTFGYYDKGGKVGIVGGFTDTVLAKPERGGRK